MTGPESIRLDSYRREARIRKPTSPPSWPSWFLLGWWILALGIVDLPGGHGSAGAAVEEGSLTRTILVLMFGAAGALHLPVAIQKLDAAGWRLLTFLAGYLGWASLSFVWSDSPALTIRRLVLATLLIVGAIGLGAGYYGQSETGRGRLARDVLVAGVIAGASVWIPALLGGGADLLAGDWALVPVAVGTAIGYPMLLSSLVSIYGRHTSAIPSPFVSQRTQALVLMGALATIISLRKRVLLAVSFLATGFLSFVFRRGRARREMLVRLGLGLTTAAVVIAFMGIDVVGTATPIVLRGQETVDVETLTGRIPLWEELMPLASESLFTGTGFGAFWTPDRMVEIEAAVGWPAVVAHNGYIDEILGTGLPGLVLLFGAFIAATITLGRRARWGDGFALLTAVWIGCYLVLNLTGTLTQDLFQFPFYSALIFAFAAFTSGSANDVSHSTTES
jgi:exopolysaccharide production protein ExoQ